MQFFISGSSRAGSTGHFSRNGTTGAAQG